MRVLIIGKIWPEPTSSAAGTRTIDLIRALKSVSWDVQFASAAQPSEHSADLAKRFSIITHSVELNASSFDSWVAHINPDIVIFDRYMTEEQFGWRVAANVPNALRVVDTSDLHSLRAARQTSLKTSEPINLHNEIALREIASVLRSDLSLIISEYEMGTLARKFPIPPESIAYWPFALPDPRKTDPRFEDRVNFVMIGSFLHEPNWDAVRFCHEHIWPKIRQSLSDVVLDVYGSYPPPRALQLDNKNTGFRIKGRAEDAIETLLRYRINLAPLRFGAGLKGKLADSFIAGTPSVATPIATEGMNGYLEWGSNVSAEPTQFAETAIKLYTDQDAWQHAQACGYEIAKNRFRESEWLPRLPAILESAFANRERNRANNFVGRMLNHHLHRSTEFMSRWIEEKTKKQVHGSTNPEEPPTPLGQPCSP